MWASLIPRQILVTMYPEFVLWIVITNKEGKINIDNVNFVNGIV